MEEEEIFQSASPPPAAQPAVSTQIVTPRHNLSITINIARNKKLRFRLPRKVQYYVTIV